MSQDTGKFRRNTKDQFYTNSEVAKKCIATLQTILPDAETEYFWIEPSAGGGSFFTQTPPCERIALDIDPKGSDIIKADFLTWSPPPTQKPILLYGNPPFGRQSSLAKSFIARGATYSSVIAFILPKSFTKPSMNRVFPPHFHCIHSADLEANAFLINGAQHDVPCVFQIWKKMETERPKEEKVEPRGFTYTTANQKYDCAFRRVGVNAGKAYPNTGAAHSPQSHYFLVLAEQYKPHLSWLLNKLYQHTFPSNTVGPRSLSKSEVNVVLNSFLEECLMTTS